MFCPQGGSFPVLPQGSRRQVFACRGPCQAWPRGSRIGQRMDGCLRLLRHMAAHGGQTIGETVVGASTAMPMSQETPEFQAPFLAQGWDVGRVFYYGESVLLPENTMPLEPDQQVLVRGRINADKSIVAEQIVVGSGQGDRGGFSHAGRGNAASSGHGGRGGSAGHAGNAGGGPGGGAGGGGGGGGSGSGGR